MLTTFRQADNAVGGSSNLAFYKSLIEGKCNDVLGEMWASTKIIKPVVSENFRV